MARSLTYILTLAFSIFVAGCGTDSSSGDPVFSQTGPSTDVTVNTTGGANTTGSRFTLQLTDAPIDGLVSVFIKFIAIEVRQKAGGGWIRYDLNDQPSIDVLSFHGTKTADLLANVNIAPGTYDEIRFFVGSGAENYVTLLSGGTVTLDMPAAASSGLKIKEEFTVPPSRPIAMVMDIDLRQSVLAPGLSGNYQFKLVYRLVNAEDIGHIIGDVDPSLLSGPGSNCSDGQPDTYNAVYVYSGTVTSPGDINQNSKSNIEPVTTSPVLYDQDMGKYMYEAAFLPAGRYTVAFTCNAVDEDLKKDDDLKFIIIDNVDVMVSSTVFL